MVGSGSVAGSVVGSGAAADSVVGPGSASSSVVGSGAAADSVVGSGAVAASVVRSGAAMSSGPVAGSVKGCITSFTVSAWVNVEKSNGSACVIASAVESTCMSLVSWSMLGNRVQPASNGDAQSSLVNR